jgi:hypothetical protein
LLLVTKCFNFSKTAMTFMKSNLAGLMLASIGLMTTAAHANLVTNGGFESGNFTGWTVSGPSGSGCNQSFVVSSVGDSSGCTGYAPISSSFVAPAAGAYAAYAAFDGSGPLNRTLTQSFSIPLGSNTASVTWADALGFGSGWTFPLARVYSVNLLNGSGGLVANLLTESFTNQTGGILQNWTTHTSDISSYLPLLSGNTAEIQFNLYVPQSFTGPGVFALDQVSVNAGTTVPEPETLALMGLGLLAIAATRRRKA